MEHSKELADIYALGFLPYSSDLTKSSDLFYLCRSVRVDLERFEDTSENRRVDRKISPLTITETLIPKEVFNLHDEHFVLMIHAYSAERFQGGNMSLDRLAYIFSRSYVTHVLVYSTKSEKIAYVLLGLSGGSMHYYYSFFNTNYLSEFSLGKWLMWKSLHIAKEQGIRYVYLGTCYGEKSLYKVRDHKGVEFFDGTSWNTDSTVISRLTQHDAKESPDVDQFKRPI